MKKIINAVLAMALCLGIFAGCSNNKAAPWEFEDFSVNNSNKTDEKIEITPTSTFISLSDINKKTMLLMKQSAA